MRTCPRCARAFAEVVGAPDQVCPHCGLVMENELALGNAAASSGPAESARTAPGPVADPVAAASLAFRTFVRQYARVSLAWTPAVVANFVASWAVLAYARAERIPLDATDLANAPRLLGVKLPSVLFVFVVELACWSLVARAAFGGAKAPRPPLGRLVAMAAMLAVALTLGLVLLVIPFCVFLHWYMFAPAEVARGESPSRAFEASRAFSRARRTAGFTTLVLLVWLGVEVALSFALEPLFEAPLRALGDGGVALGDALAGWVLGPLVPLFPAAYWSLARREPDGPVAVSGPPPASPAPATRTTACPQCGTVFPFVPTGAPVDVVCPECGRAGRIL